MTTTTAAAATAARQLSTPPPTPATKVKAPSATARAPGRSSSGWSKRGKTVTMATVAPEVSWRSAAQQKSSTHCPHRFAHCNNNSISSSSSGSSSGTSTRGDLEATTPTTLQAHHTSPPHRRLCRQSCSSAKAAPRCTWALPASAVRDSMLYIRSGSSVRSHAAVHRGRGLRAIQAAAVAPIVVVVWHLMQHDRATVARCKVRGAGAPTTAVSQRVHCKRAGSSSSSSSSSHNTPCMHPAVVSCLRQPIARPD